MMEPTGEMTPEQHSAIGHSVRIGSLLVIDHPEIAELYRNGMTHSGIAENLNVKREYGIPSDEVAKISIHHAITGHNGGFGTEPHDGLIPNLDERAELEYEHRAKGGRIAGRKTVEEGTGVHGLTPEQRSEYGRKTVEDGTGIHGLAPEQRSEYSSKGGRIAGRKAVEDGTGIHGLTPEQRSEYGRKAVEDGTGVHGYNPKTGERYVVENGRKAVEDGTGIHGLTPEQKSEYSSKGGKIGGIKATLAQGKTLWEKEETEYAHLLSLEPEFQHQKGKHKGKGDYKTIAQVLNVDYHNGEEVRSPQAVKINLSKYIKTLGN